MPKLDRDQLDQLKANNSITAMLNGYGYKVRGGMCLCPLHNEKTPSCEVYEREGRFYCHGCGQGGDQIDLLRHLKNLPFDQAIESLGGPQALTEEERAKIKKRREAWEKQEREKEQKERSAAQQLFAKGTDIKGTLASKYLRKRGLTPEASWWFDLRFLPAVPYRGFESATSEEQTLLGEYPAMLAAIRDPLSNEIIGCHRTYIDKSTGLNIVPPGDRVRNKKKKILGNFKGGVIFLSPPGDTLAIGEGIETTRSAFELGIGDATACAAGVNLWNICGSALGSYPHPKSAEKRVSNLEPDAEKDGFAPPSWAKRIILCGDGDSEYYYTRAMMATAAARLKGKGYSGSVFMAPKGQDWNTYHRHEQGLSA